MGELTHTVMEPANGQGFALTRVQDHLAWARKYSPIATAALASEPSSSLNAPRRFE
jgi:hypothetical protein